MKNNVSFSTALSQKYVKTANTILKHLTNFNNDKTPDWDDLNNAFLSLFMTYLSKKVSQRTAQIYCSKIRTLLNKDKTENNILSFETAFRKKYYTKANYILKHLTAFNNDHIPQWDDLKKLFLIRFVNYLKTEVSPNTARTYCAYLKSFLNDYSDEVEIPCRDFATILSVKSVGVSHVYLTENEIISLLNYQPTTQTEQIVLYQFLLSCFTGMRHSDVIKLELSNTDDKQITYLSEKTRTLVRTPNSKIITNLISKVSKKKISLNRYNFILRNICEKVGINNEVKVIEAGEEVVGAKFNFITSHTARRSFASNLYSETRDIYLVSKLMGHSDIKMTQKYICCDHIKNDAVKDFLAKYDAIITQ